MGAERTFHSRPGNYGPLGDVSSYGQFDHIQLDVPDDKCRL